MIHNLSSILHWEQAGSLYNLQRVDKDCFECRFICILDSFVERMKNEEIKINKVTVFVNPYAELDEEEEEEEENKENEFQDEEKVCFIYFVKMHEQDFSFSPGHLIIDRCGSWVLVSRTRSGLGIANPGAGTVGSGSAGGGIGKYFEHLVLLNTFLVLHTHEIGQDLDMGSECLFTKAHQPSTLPQSA